MAGTKTSVWLGEEQHAQWKASGDSLTEIVKRGLATPKAETKKPLTAAEVREIIREEINAADGMIRRIIRDELASVAGQSHA